MNVLVIYDSVFGNTEQIAQAIGKAFGSQEDVDVIRVSDAKLEQLAGLELLLVGSPTRAFRPTKAITDFLRGIPSNGLKGVKVAAFDTRMPVDDVGPAILRFLAKLFGYAAKPISDRLIRKGGTSAIPPEGFVVEGTEGPLREGELERAADWAKKIVTSP